MHGDGGVLEIRPARRGAETYDRGGQAVADLISINLLEVMAMVVTAFVMVDMRGDRPGRKGEAVLMRADNEAAVTSV